ncbi:hypothetical protein UlMin_009551 [Ulmus minor]
MNDSGRATSIPVPTVENPDQLELIRTLEASIGLGFSSKPLWRNPNPLIIVISEPSGVGKDAVIKKLRETYEGLHFVITATSREMRPAETLGKDYFFVSKEEFLEMVEKKELLEHALVHGDYKGIPKQQIRDFMAKGYDITLRKIFGRTVVFVFVMAGSEIKLVERKLLVRVATTREEVKHFKNFDYIVVNVEGELDNAVKLMKSIIDAEKARARQRTAVI